MEVTAPSPHPGNDDRGMAGRVSECPIGHAPSTSVAPAEKSAQQAAAGTATGT